MWERGLCFLLSCTQGKGTLILLCRESLMRSGAVDAGMNVLVRWSRSSCRDRCREDSCHQWHLCQRYLCPHNNDLKDTPADSIPFACSEANSALTASIAASTPSTACWDLMRAGCMPLTHNPVQIAWHTGLCHNHLLFRPLSTSAMPDAKLTLTSGSAWAPLFRSVFRILELCATAWIQLGWCGICCRERERELNSVQAANRADGTQWIVHVRVSSIL